MKITKELLREMIAEEIAALNEEDSAIKDTKEFVARLEQHGQSKGGFKNDKIRKMFIKVALEAAMEQNKLSKSSGGVFPMYPRLFNDIVNTIEKGIESKIYKQSAAPASKTKTSVTDCKISGLRRVKMDIKNNILTVIVEKDGKQATGSHPVKSANRMNLAMNAAGLKARTAWIKKYGCPK